MDGPEYAGRTVLVVGAARSGIAAALFLLARGASVVLTDVKTAGQLHEALAPLTPFEREGSLTMLLGGQFPDAFGRCDLVVLSPGVPLTLSGFEVSRRAGIPIIGEPELAWRHLKGMVLGITGSNGKTTTTALTAEFLRGAGLNGHAAGNIGLPLVSFADRSTDSDIFVVELSSFQLESIVDFRPRAAALLNLTPDHLDRYPGFNEYVEAKKRIFMNQAASDFAVLNFDDPRTAALAAEVSSLPVWFSRRGEPGLGAFLRDGQVFYQGPEGGSIGLFPVDDIRLKGEHNLENVLAACALALLAGAGPETLRSTVLGFTGVEHRLEWVAEVDGVQYFNDSKATNVDAAVKSLEAFPGGVHVILGGKDKGGDFTVLRPLVAHRVRHAVLIGQAAHKIREALEGATVLSDAATLEEALAQCRANAQPGDVVLLAPACASFDMFQDYEHRGRVFKEAVRALRSGVQG